MKKYYLIAVPTIVGVLAGGFIWSIDFNFNIDTTEFDGLAVALMALSLAGGGFIAGLPATIYSIYKKALPWNQAVAIWMGIGATTLLVVGAVLSAYAEIQS